MEPLLVRNLYWMAFNANLAFLAVLFGLMMLKTKRKWAKWLFFILWTLFTPNTLYILTDVYHFSQQFGKVTGLDSIYLVVQYIFLIPFGLVSYVYAMEPFEKLLSTINTTIINHYARYIVFFTNFIIAFGIVIGRVQRTNSWEVFTNTVSVFHDSVRTISSLDLMIVVIVVGIFANCIYFGTKNIIMEVTMFAYKKISSHLLS